MTDTFDLSAQEGGVSRIRELETEIDRLSGALRWEQNPSRAEREKGHDGRCARVHWPRDVLPCDCGMREPAPLPAKEETP